MTHSGDDGDLFKNGVILPAFPGEDAWFDAVNAQIADLGLAARFKSDSVLILFVGVALNWIPARKNNVIVMRAPDGITMEIPLVDSLNAKALRQRFRTIVRHGLTEHPPFALAERIIEHTRPDPDRARMIREAVIEYEAHHSKAVPTGVQEVKITAAKAAKRKIVRTEQWSAHGAVGPDGISQTYPSAAVWERTWSDGFTDFACRGEECNYTNDNPRSVASHYANVHTRGQGRATQAPADGIDPDYTPSKKARIRRLSRELDGALTAAFASGIDWSVTDQAQWMAEWVINHRVEALPGETEDVRELDPDQILDRIAALVDRGRGHVLREQISTLYGQLDDADARVVEVEAAKVAAEEAAAAAEARAEKASNNLQALRDLINETEDNK